MSAGKTVLTTTERLVQVLSDQTAIIVKLVDDLPRYDNGMRFPSEQDEIRRAYLAERIKSLMLTGAKLARIASARLEHGGHEEIDALELKMRLDHFEGVLLLLTSLTIDILHPKKGKQ